MHDHHGRGPMTDEQLGRLIAGLPKRRPRAGLRDRVLAPEHQRPRVGLRRPLVAWACLALLLAADVAVLKLQGAGAAPNPARPAPLAAETPQNVDMLALLDDAGMLGANRPLLGLAAQSQAAEDTYFALRKRMLPRSERSPSNG